jgi:hypothetical protein
MFARKIIASVAIALGLALAGCGEKEPSPEEWVAIDDLPAPIITQARKELPDVKFTRAWKVHRDGKEAYEMRGLTKNGKTREIMIGLDGKVLEME